jgi:hypothetical protein
MVPLATATIGVPEGAARSRPVWLLDHMPPDIPNRAVSR